MPNPLTVGRRATARLEEAILLALEEHRDRGYLSTLRLAERIGWDNDGMPSPNGQGYGRIAVIGLLYKLYLDGRVPAVSVTTSKMATAPNPSQCVRRVVMPMCIGQASFESIVASG